MAPLQPLPVIDQPFSRIAMDFVEPLPRTKQGKSYILVLMDYNQMARGKGSVCTYKQGSSRHDFRYLRTDLEFLMRFSQTEAHIL